MRNSPNVWLVFMALSIAVWLAGVGAVRHPAVRMVIAFTFLGWSGYVLSLRAGSNR